jgi:hypothetical protein
VAEWIWTRAVMLHYTMNQTDPGSNPRAGMVYQIVHPSGVGKLVTISIKWVTAVEVSEGKSVRRMQPVAQTTVRWFPTVRTGL